MYEDGGRNDVDEYVYTDNEEEEDNVVVEPEIGKLWIIKFDYANLVNHYHPSFKKQSFQ
jgi:hypothetical protein